jgi:hypothetical protein
VSTVVAAVATMAVIAAAGALPVLVLVGFRWVAVPLTALAGSVIAAVAAALMVAVGGTLLGWFVTLATCSAIVVIALWILRPTTRPWGHGEAGRDRTGTSVPRRVPGLLAFIGVVAAAAWSLEALRTPSVGFDARTIWMLHARWYVQGHGTSLAALRNTALPFAHASYPPLVGATVALSWVITGNQADRFGVVVVALLNACAAMAAAWVLVDLGRRCGQSMAEARRRAGAVSVGLGAGIVPYAVGATAAVLLVLVAFGVAGPFATNGYADMLWAASAVGAVGYGLVLPGRRGNIASAAVLLAVAGLTKDEGYVTAMAIVALLALRSAISAPVGHTGRWWRPAVFGVVGVVGLGLWPLLTRLLQAAPNAAAPGRRDGNDASRFHASVVSMAAHLHVLLLAAPVALVGAIILSRARRALGLGSDGWTWAALGTGLAFILIVYVTGPANIELWLITSTHRTTMYGALLGWWVVAIWAVIASAHGVRRRPRRPGTSPRSA